MEGYLTTEGQEYKIPMSRCLIYTPSVLKYVSFRTSKLVPHMWWPVLPVRYWSLPYVSHLHHTGYFTQILHHLWLVSVTRCVNQRFMLVQPVATNFGLQHTPKNTHMYADKSSVTLHPAKYSHWENGCIH